MKKIVYYVWSGFLALVVLETLAGVVDITLLQLLPIIAIWILVHLDIYAKKNYRNGIIVLSLFMILINLTGPISIIDIFLWLITTIAYAKNK
jgi:hypothetical protein